MRTLITLSRSVDEFVLLGHGAVRLCDFRQIKGAGRRCRSLEVHRRGHRSLLQRPVVLHGEFLVEVDARDRDAKVASHDFANVLIQPRRVEFGLEEKLEKGNDHRRAQPDDEHVEHAGDVGEIERRALLRVLGADVCALAPFVVPLLLEPFEKAALGQLEHGDVDRLAKIGAERRADAVAFGVDVLANAHRIARQALVDVLVRGRLEQEGELALRPADLLDALAIRRDEHVVLVQLHEVPHAFERDQRRLVEERHGRAAFHRAVANVGLLGQILDGFNRRDEFLHGEKSG